MKTLLSPRFAPVAEQAFWAKYYQCVRPTLRVVAGLVALAWCLDFLLDLGETSHARAFALPAMSWCLLIFALTWAPGFERSWKSAFVLTAWLATGLMFGALAWSMQLGLTPISEVGAQRTVAQLLFALHICVWMIVLAAFRLPFAATLTLQSGVVTLGAAAFYLGLAGATAPLGALRFLAPVLLVWLAALLISWVQEGLARGAFESDLRLSELQDQEHQKRVESEGMLRALNGAIGTIVHDLRNPLTTIQIAATLTEDMMHKDEIDRTLLDELNRIVSDGAKMMSHLCLSLLEQTRALEGAPVPVELRSVSLHAIAETGASFQKHRITPRRSLTIEGDDATICADELKMVTAMVNLISNALKYSDGAVMVHWKAYRGEILIAVCDQGTKGLGLSRKSAARLFRAFGRLENHAHIEGTGLGLLSIQKIIEAHGGQAFIEGYESAAPDAARFSTAHGSFPSMLAPGFRTAFVLTCPLYASAATPRALERNRDMHPLELESQNSLKPRRLSEVSL